MEMTQRLMSAGIPAKFRNSYQEYLVKLVTRGADEVMSIERAAEVLGMRPETLYRQTCQGTIKLISALRLEDLALLLYRDPGLAPKLDSRRETISKLTSEQLDYIEQVSDRQLNAHPALGLDRSQFIRALTMSYTRNPNQDWHYAIDLLADRLIAKIIH